MTSKKVEVESDGTSCKPLSERASPAPGRAMLAQPQRGEGRAKSEIDGEETGVRGERKREREQAQGGESFEF